mmetsp:Transcript_11198/g.27528  ORF Transcript_11198/g.27528 Transcript_11198/m.27528 type:complete len:188 (-) Transcript_11198:266-829(-)|eukprot:CAMPEP_0181108608 /NCGR_PEP_ID=MMETSP1071-20121207/17719_1 /TAXON_ID=35127 /ORGANISM="Thalassiosira sp., Strain NH16" /LENGTH=187 /DNA_ID=CAMNT_0023192219 /DNA_START=13 /DNA_END=576 /DNA_ORIENTATION=+
MMSTSPSLIADYPYECIHRHRLKPDDMHAPPYCASEDTATRKKKRTVQFSTTSVLHCYDTPENDGCGSSTSYYSSEEEQQFKRQAKIDIMCFRLMKESGSEIKSELPDDMLCPVGLEKSLISKDYTKKRAITKRLVMLAVLAEQSQTLHQKIDDKWERIAAASRQHSEWSRTQARTIGSFQANSANS